MDQNLSERAKIAHLYRRAGFGATASQLDALETAGYDAAVDGLLEPVGNDQGVATLPAPVYGPIDADRTTEEGRKAARQEERRRFEEMGRWWLDRMAGSDQPLTEKLTFLWHGHFATALDKVKSAALMLRQNETFRSLGRGGFEELTSAVVHDPAMLLYLDGNNSTKEHPNENLGRELVELFTLGIGNYTEADIVDVARALTGLTLSRDHVASGGSALLNQRRHDDGTKNILGVSGNHGPEEAVEIIVADSGCESFIVARLWSKLAFPIAPDSEIAESLRSSFSGRDIPTLLGAIFRHPEFVASSSTDGLVKQPLEYFAGACRALGLRPSELRGATRLLRDLNQLPFSPPSVGGWPPNGYWLSTATAYGRVRLAAALADAADLSSISDAAPAERSAALERLLSIEFTDETRGVLTDLADDPLKITAVALQTPEYVLN